MGDAEKVVVPNRTGPGSSPQEPVAFVAKMSDSERSALESDGRGGLASAPELTTPPEIRCVYYLLYADGYEIPSKVAIDPEEPSLGCIWADCIAPPHNPTSIIRSISRVERNPALTQHLVDLFADTSCHAPLKEGHISFLRTDGPGLSPNEPMAIVHSPPPIQNGRYVIKNRAADIFWGADGNLISTVYFYLHPIEGAKNVSYLQWDITHDTNGHISMRSMYYASSWWVGAEITGSTVPVLWRLIPADNESYYLTTDMNCDSQNLRVPAAKPNQANGYGSMAALKEGDQLQMWEFIPI